MSKSIARLRKRLRTVRAGEITRRYFVLNAFDGALTTVGIIMGAYFAGVSSGRVILVAGLTANLAMGISGAWGAYMSERAERIRSIKELERALFTNLEGSVIERASRTTVFFVAFVDAISPLLASLACLVPVILSTLGLMTVEMAVLSSFLAGVLVLFSLGIFLGRVSRTNVWVQGGLMMAAGFLILLIAYLFGVG